MNRVELNGRAGSRTPSSLDLESNSSSHVGVTSLRIEKRLRPKRAPGQHRVQRSGAALPRLQKRLNHKRGRRNQVTLDQRSRNPQDAEAPARELPVASRVVRALGLVALVPINLDNERGFAREEVDDVIANDDLPTELDAKQPATAHHAPHQRFSVTGILTERPSALFEERFAHGTLS